MNIKTLLYIAAAALACGACTSDDDPATDAVTDGASKGFTATVGDRLDVMAEEDLGAGQSRQTRSSIDTGDQAVTWAATDKISISDGTLCYVFSPREETIDGASCSFQSKTANTFITDGTGTDATFHAFYPADAVTGWNGSVVSTMVYTEQSHAENLDASGVMGPYMAATATSTDGGARASFVFGHVCSIVDVDLSAFDGGTVDAVSLYANSQVSIAGRMRFDMGTKRATVSTSDGTGYSFSTQSETVRVSEVNADRPATVRFFLLPVRQEKGFTITVRTTDGRYFTKSSATAVGNATTSADHLAAVDGVSGGTVCKPYYKRYKFGTTAGARTQNWMAMIPGNVKFNHLSIPGTHDAATSGCTSQTDYTICQSFTIAEQLAKGARAFDLRPHTSKTSSDGSPTITHASYSTNVSLKQALAAIASFLDTNPTETAFVLIHEEDASSHSTTWSGNVWSTVREFAGHIATYGWRGNLNPCRGKMVVMFRDAYTDGANTADLGCGKVGWGSSFNPKSIMIGNGSANADGAYTLYYQDEYDTSSSSDKLSNLVKMLTEHIAANETNADRTYVNNTNIAKWSLFGGTANTTLANNVNTAVLGSQVFTGHTGRFGIMMTDFLFSLAQKGDKMFELIHGQNFKYVYLNRTRLSSDTGTDTGAKLSTDEYADDSQVFSRRR